LVVEIALERVEDLAAMNPASTVTPGEVAQESLAH
jgi:hypothetical protein